MTQTQPGSVKKYGSLMAAVAVIVCFFLPWVKWVNVPVTAKDMATGNFYSLSETNFAITNPFPDFVFVNGISVYKSLPVMICSIYNFLRLIYAMCFFRLSVQFVLRLRFVFYVLLKNIGSPACIGSPAYIKI